MPNYVAWHGRVQRGHEFHNGARSAADPAAACTHARKKPTCLARNPHPTAASQCAVLSDAPITSRAEPLACKSHNG